MSWLLLFPLTDVETEAVQERGINLLKFMREVSDNNREWTQTLQLYTENILQSIIYSGFQ